MSSRETIEALYAEQPDPWNYSTDPYEQEKYRRTLAALPRDRYGRGLEVGCSEGVFSRLAALRVDTFLGVDISSVAVARARERCSDLSNASFRPLDFIDNDLDERFDAIFCSEVLYYVPPPRRLDVARKLAGWLVPGGDLVLVHTWRTYTQTWEDIHGETGAEGLHRLFTRVLGMPVVGYDATDDYEVLVVRAEPTVVPAWRRKLALRRLLIESAACRAMLVARRYVRGLPLVHRITLAQGKEDPNDDAS